ncbi:hypothetical protein RF11_00882 [Thelohanellus kitauei]|uniref:Uncharacterized protein n=1 Tax=Thelohanellus kitauei TaxID=669202 RepID=A0A0C2IL01_THEKT|nr:hypothetical protein RF11_00882 [Thelohanellus kitauei]
MITAMRWSQEAAGCVDPTWNSFLGCETDLPAHRSLLTILPFIHTTIQICPLRCLMDNVCTTRDLRLNTPTDKVLVYLGRKVNNCLYKIAGYSETLTDDQNKVSDGNFNMSMVSKDYCNK